MTTATRTRLAVFSFQSLFATAAFIDRHTSWRISQFFERILWFINFVGRAASKSIDLRVQARLRNKEGYKKRNVSNKMKITRHCIKIGNLNYQWAFGRGKMEIGYGALLVLTNSNSHDLQVNLPKTASRVCSRRKGFEKVEKISEHSRKRRTPEKWERSASICDNEWIIGKCQKSFWKLRKGAVIVSDCSRRRKNAWADSGDESSGNQFLGLL